MVQGQQRVILPSAPGALPFSNLEYSVQSIYASGYYKKLTEEAERYMHSEELYTYVQSKTQTSMSLNIFPLKTRRDAECTL